MRVFHHLRDFPFLQQPIILTIGNFDGVHCGHQYILKAMSKDLFSPTQTCVITFNNHPSEVLNPFSPTPLICSLAHKINLLKEAHIDNLLLLTFDTELAQQTAENFIQEIRSYIPFSRLILGYDATLGKNRQGDKSKMKQLAKQYNFDIDYTEEYCHQENPISSTLIRKYLQEGKLSEVEQLLGRPYSIYSTIGRGANKGKLIGFPTANLNVANLCLPPYGVYKVTLKHNKNCFAGIANLGLAPTLKNSKTPILEAHLFSFSDDLYDKEVEVIFHEFIRPEKKFSSIEELRIQIKKDIEKLKEFRTVM